MTNTGQVDDFLASAHILAAAVREVLEQRLVDRVVTGRITAAQVKLLQLVAITEEYTLSEVASFLDVSNAAASKGVDRLVRLGLLRRAEDTVDRRNIHLSLTPAGRRLVKQHESARRAKLDQIFGGMAMEELQRASELLDRISARFVDHASGPNEPCLKCGVYFREECRVRELTGRRCLYQTPARKTAERNGLCV